MKKIIYSVLLLLVSFLGFAQVPYSNYWDFTSEWRTYSGGWNGISGFSYYSTRYFDGYEVVNGISYYKEYTNQRYRTTNWDGSIVDETTLYGPILTREDESGNFYRISPNDGVEYLTFSNQEIINAQLGDPFPYPGASCIVEIVETNYLGTTALKRIKGNVTGTYGGSLEGVGVIGPNCGLGIEGNGWVNCYTKQNTTIQFVDSIDCASFPPVNRVNLGVGNIDQAKKEFSVYPNPNHGIFKINRSLAITNLSFEIYNINGLKIKAGNLTSSEESVDISSFSSGVYIMKINSDNSSEYLKIVKE